MKVFEKIIECMKCLKTLAVEKEDIKTRMVAKRFQDHFDTKDQKYVCCPECNTINPIV